MQSICSICSHKGYPLNGFSKSRMIKIVFFMCFILDLTCLSLFFITSERIELESWDWAQKMRLSKLHLDLSLSAFDSSIPSSYLRRNLECVFFIERISRFTLYSTGLCLLQLPSELLLCSHNSYRYKILKQGKGTDDHLLPLGDCFLDLYMRVCPFAGPSVRRVVTNELKSIKIAVFDQNCDR